MSPGLSYAIGVGAIALVLGAAGVAQLRSRNANIVDPLWTITLGLLGVWLAAAGTSPPAARLVVAASAGTWALRLGLHLYRRNRGAPEDKRYARFRRQWAASAGWKMLLFIESQTVFSALLGLPFVVIAWRDDAPPAWALVAAVVVATVSVAGEAIADRQLARFRGDASNRGRLNRRGLWGWSRHPNYFFECLHWFTYLLLVVGSPWWWVGLVPPAVMAWLLLKLSGIPMVEEQMARERPEYAEYMRTTSALIPWPPRKAVMAAPS